MRCWLGSIIFQRGKAGYVVGWEMRGKSGGCRVKHTKTFKVAVVEFRFVTSDIVDPQFAQNKSITVIHQIDTAL